MADGQDKDDKTEEATARRLEDARKRGDIIYSQEVGAALSLGAATLIVALFAAPIAASLARMLSWFFANAASAAVDPGALQRMAAGVLLATFTVIGGAAVALALAGVASRYLQDKPTLTAERLKPELSKIDPIKGFGRVFGAQAASQFFKALAKFAVVGAAMTWALWPRDATIEQSGFIDLRMLLPLAQERAVALLFALAIAAAAIAGIDYLATRQSYMKRQRMSRRDLRDEMRQSEGDPLVKMRLRQIRMERSRTRMLAAVPQASVVVTNPTHYAVALRYDADETPAPICVAKGVDEVALRIRETAAEHNVPIVEDPPLARALFASADLDQPIPREHYEAVARVIGYVMSLARRRRPRAPSPNQR
jgi:flagellar biosynthetic protein FlhB